MVPFALDNDGTGPTTRGGAIGGHYETRPMTISTAIMAIVSAENSHASPLKNTSARKMPRQNVLFMHAAP